MWLWFMFLYLWLWPVETQIIIAGGETFKWNAEISFNQQKKCWSGESKSHMNESLQFELFWGHKNMMKKDPFLHVKQDISNF